LGLFDTATRNTCSPKLQTFTVKSS